ncbi:hypothetical protein CVT24_001780 [Panaeolus cyanescens]|uniref:Uncharacterized protein n=1 Tax=Panaeolus cyanescens TaxID=181874 RepID=A0A409YFS0_9AGAR|nr:hypothetical protein CVT24_001780 [Panaeolus cyanescens]
MSTTPALACIFLRSPGSQSTRVFADGIPYDYIIAGCPCLVANLWDVVSPDIDIFAQAVHEKLSLGGVRASSSRISIASAVAQSRDSCDLKYIIGAAPIVYGIPVFLEA